MTNVRRDGNRPTHTRTAASFAIPAGNTKANVAAATAAVAVVAHPVQKDRLRPEPFQTEARFTSRPAVRLGMPLNPQVA